MKETLDEQSRRDLVKYRLERAYETLKEAALLEENQYYNAAVNRLYYACYYATVALLLKYKITASTHAGVKTMLGLHFVSKDILSKEHGRTFSRLFEVRHSSDYDDFVYCNADMVREYSEKAKLFVDAVGGLLEPECNPADNSN